MTFTWDTQNTRQASELWKEGHSASYIGNIIGSSRSSVLGKAHRHRDLFPQRVTSTSTYRGRSRKGYGAAKPIVDKSTYTPATKSKANVARRGEGLHLKNGKGYLHLSGMSLTNERAYFWRGTARQANAMMKASPHELTIVQETT